MWLIIDSHQQQAVEDITVLQALFLVFKFVNMSETKESFAPRTNALLVGVLISD